MTQNKNTNAHIEYIDGGNKDIEHISPEDASYSKGTPETKGSGYKVEPASSEPNKGQGCVPFGE